MLPLPLPLWLRLLIVDAVAQYHQTAAMLEQRCAEIATSGRRDEWGRLRDDKGSIDEYRMDAKYCAGMAVRLPKLLDESLTAEERTKILRELAALENGDNQHSQELPTDPQRLAQWAWQNPWQDAVATPLPADAIRIARPSEELQALTQREAEALILCKGLGMTAEEAAPIMRTTPKSVEIAVQRARSRLQLMDLLS